MKWTNYDKNQVVNLIVGLKKAKFEMTGMEVVAFADVFRWVSGLHDLIEKDLIPKPPIELNTIAITPPPVPVVDEKIKVKKVKAVKHNES